MIRSFKSKALSRYWTKGDASGIHPDWLSKVKLVLSRLDAADAPEQMDIPGLGYHVLSPKLGERHAVSVSRNWRITFDWGGEDAVAVDMEDYHGK
ncbi:type II toxin-antitoxin system RelE/ParE family toxin [Xanthobacter pseudotagetidis]|uniref:type II toxin-antitoxin system RelE/ParE family toxin n=1 Tax=Xanthobacter pseudotagetidis TaxID=3119911 RepID=UPI00372A6EED